MFLLKNLFHSYMLKDPEFKDTNFFFVFSLYSKNLICL